MTPTPSLPDSTAVVGVPTPEQIEALADAMAQLLDDMDEHGLAVCGAAKAKARVAYEPWNTEPHEWQPAMRMDAALRVLIECEELHGKPSKLRQHPALASCSTQLEGKAPYQRFADEPRPVMPKGFSAPLKPSWECAPKPLPQPETAASGDVAKIMQSFVDDLAQAAWVYGYVEGQGRPFDAKNDARKRADECRVPLLTAIRSLAAQARAQALETAIAKARELEDGWCDKADELQSVRYEGMAAGAQLVGSAIRALILQPPALAGSNPSSAGASQ